MRRVIALLAVAGLVTGCATGAGPTKAPTAAPQDTVVPTTLPTAAATPNASPAVISGRLTFDGTTCTYTGPTVVSSPAVLNLEFAPTDEAFALNIGTVQSGTTLEEVKATDGPEFGPAPGKKVPDWLLPDTWHAKLGSGTAVYDLAIRQNFANTYDQVAISCVRDPWTSDKAVDTVEGRTTATLIKLVPA